MEFHMAATRAVQGKFTEVVESSATPLYDSTSFIVSFEGGSMGTVELEVDYGDGWKSIYEITSNEGNRINATKEGHLYRFNCTVYTAGSEAGAGIAYRLG